MVVPSSRFVAAAAAALSQLAARDYEHPYPRARAEITTNIHFVYPVRAEMLWVAFRDPAARSDRSVLCLAVQRLGRSVVLARGGPRAMSILRLRPPPRLL